jgi:tetratricopeptide (TPR) repeat protein
MASANKYARFFPIGLFLLGFLLYANTFGHQYALDDAIVIYDNEFTQKGVEGIGDILKYDTFRGFFKVEGKEQLVSGGRYRPLTLVLFAIEVELFGLNPLVGHLVNALLYGLLVLLIYKLVLLFFAKAKPEKAQWIALVTALLFAVHPIHTEAVANIKGADEITTMLGGLAAIYFSMRAFDRKKWAGHILAAVLFFFGLLAKENAITLVAVVPLAYYFFRNVPLLKTISPTLPFLGGAAVFLAIRGAVLGWGLGEPTMELMNNPFIKLEGNQWVPFSAGEKMATIFYTLGKYIQLLVFPYPLTHDYYPRQIGIMTFANPGALLSLLLYMALLAYAVWGLLKKKAMSFGVWFYLLSLSIVSNIVFPIGTNMGERFIFMPSLGFCLAIAMLLSAWTEKNKTVKPMVNWAGAAVLFLFAVMTLVRNPIWKDNFTLFTTDVKTSPNSAKLQNSAGGETIAYALTLQNEQARNSQLEKAVGHLKEAIRIHPTYKNAYLLLGNAHNYLRRFEESISYYDIALRIDPNYPESLRNRAVTYRDAGKYAGEKEGNAPKAESFLIKALEAMPNDYETLRLLGVASGVQGKNQEAIRYFSLATQVEPNNADAWFNLSIAHYNAGNMAEFAQFEQKAKEIDPDIMQKRNTRQ